MSETDKPKATDDVAGRNKCMVMSDDDEIVSCWSCRANIGMVELNSADGDCPHCGVEIDLTETPYA